MQRPFAGALTAAGGVCLLVAGLAVIDERVRDQVGGLLGGRGPSGELVTIGTKLQDLTWIAFEAVKYQSIEHAPLTIFALAATVLVVFMLRT